MLIHQVFPLVSYLVNQYLSIPALPSCYCLCRIKSNVIPVVCAEDGDLFLWGSNRHGQLTTTDPFMSSPTPLKRSLLGGEKVTNVWSGWTHVVAQTGEARKFILSL